MGQNIESLIKELEIITEYRDEFTSVFPNDGITSENIGKAIATFERTIVSGIAPFDEWIMGNENSISQEAKRGFNLFNGKANCVSCHEGWNFSDLSFHDIGLNSDDVGRHAIFEIDVLRSSFKTPTLRNIAERAPYMHDGSISTLEEVVDHYNDGFVTRESLSSEIKPLNLSQSEKKDILEFLLSLSSDDEIFIPTQLSE